MRTWLNESNFLVVVAVPDELALAELAARSMEEGIARTLVREPDLNNSLTAVALEPGADARRLCANFPLALRNKNGRSEERPSGMLSGDNSGVHMTA